MQQQQHLGPSQPRSCAYEELCRSSATTAVPWALATKERKSAAAYCSCTRTVCHAFDACANIVAQLKSRHPVVAVTSCRFVAIERHLEIENDATAIRMPGTPNGYTKYSNRLSTFCTDVL